MITVALAKGALLRDSVARFQAAGLDFRTLLEPDNRLLMVPSACGRARALLVRNADVPVYVAYGQAQLGVVGYDVLREHRLPVAPLVDLGFGGCRMAVAVKQSSGYRRAADLPAHCRIACKEPSSSRRARGWPIRRAVLSKRSSIATRPLSRKVRPVATRSTIASDMPVIGPSSTEPVR
jgi:ATP phosphoribosyltransferase